MYNVECGESEANPGHNGRESLSVNIPIRWVLLLENERIDFCFVLGFCLLGN